MNRRILGLTFIELLVTLSIVALLASLVLPLSKVIVQRQKEQELRIVLRDVRTAIDTFRAAAVEGHVILPQGASGYPPSLASLVEGVDDAKDPSGRKLYFLRRLPRDPMHPDTSLPPADTWGVRAYDSSPDNPKPGDDVYDIFSLSTGIGLNGVPYAQW